MNRATRSAFTPCCSRDMWWWFSIAVDPRCSIARFGASVQKLGLKRDLDQALNVKEFAVLAGVSYSVAREWFHLPGFPAVLGKVFWGDFVLWRRTRNGLKSPHSPDLADKNENGRVEFGLNPAKTPHQWPPRAAKILSEVH